MVVVRPAPHVAIDVLVVSAKGLLGDVIHSWLLGQPIGK
jgi:hypothetical protein